MRLGLIDRLRRLARRREAVGRHRRDPGGDAEHAEHTELAGRGRPRPAAPQSLTRSAQPLTRSAQPLAQLPQRTLPPWQAPPPVPAGPRAPAVSRKPADAPGDPARGGGGIGRARIRELPAHARPAGAQQAGARPAQAQLAGTPHAEAELAGARYAEAEYAEAEYAAPVEAPSRVMPREPWYQVVTGLPAVRPGPGRTATSGALAAGAVPGQALPGQTLAQVQQVATAQAQAVARVNALAGPAPVATRSAARSRLPYVAGHPIGHPVTPDGRRNCGPLERILHRQWQDGARLPAAIVTAIDRLAELPRHLQQKLADGLNGIFVGPGGVPELDEMGELRGVALPSGRATWDACAGAYGERKLVVGSRLSPTPDVMCHEVGHALDDLDAPAGRWLSDSPEFRAVYDHCKPHIVSDFHRQRGGLGRKEFFADAFAAIASGQRPALVDMLGGDTRSALWMMLYFNRRYGI
jgi:hypothetical protein